MGCTNEREKRKEPEAVEPDSPESPSLSASFSKPRRRGKKDYNIDIKGSPHDTFESIISNWAKLDEVGTR
jgi:hypothetical protein